MNGDFDVSISRHSQSTVNLCDSDFVHMRTIRNYIRNPASKLVMQSRVAAGIFTTRPMRFRTHSNPPCEC